MEADKNRKEERGHIQGKGLGENLAPEALLGSPGPATLGAGPSHSRLSFFPQI